MAHETNEAERRRWNDPYWSSVWPRREELTGAVTEILLGHLRLQPGERVLDVGAGGGTASLAAAVLVGARGAVVGADLSVPLTGLAAERARRQGLANVSFVVADAQQDRIEGAPFDAVVSQFGVMFFDDPVAAFANLRDQTAPAGRLAFACWQPAERNPWFAGPVVGRFVPPPAPPAASVPGRPAPGPFAFGDEVAVAGILESAGWSAVERTPYEQVMAVAADAIVDDAHLAFSGVEPDRMDEARRAIGEHLDRLRVGDGRVEAALAFQVFTAAR